MPFNLSSSLMGIMRRCLLAGETPPSPGCRSGAPSFQLLRTHSLDNPQPGLAAAQPVGKQPLLPLPPTLPRLKPIKQVCEQFNGQSALCLCQTLMNAHYFFFFFCFLGAFFSCRSLTDA